VRPSALQREVADHERMRLLMRYLCCFRRCHGAHARRSHAVLAHMHQQVDCCARCERCALPAPRAKSRYGPAGTCSRRKRFCVHACFVAKRLTWLCSHSYRAVWGGICVSYTHDTLRYRVHVQSERLDV
jgi:hypothetical protein